MPKKSRTPPPPRRPVQAPKKRTDPRKPRQTKIWLTVLGGAALVAAAAVGIAFAMSRGGGESASGVCKEQTFLTQGNQHSPPYKIPKDFKYNSFPPTSGPHDPVPAIWNAYDKPVPEKKLIHNEEHGGVVVQYGSDIAPTTVDAIVAWYRESPNAMVVAPLPDTKQAAKLRDKIVLTAWWAELENEDDPQSAVVRQEGHLMTCSRFDEGEFSKFRDDNRGHGPERFRVEDLQPGT